MPDDEEVTRRMADPMREPIFINLTVRVDNFVRAFARFRAWRDGTSLNAVIADMLSDYAGVPAKAIDRRRPRPVIRPRTIYEEARREDRRWRGLK
jgi:hypothetical protein